MANTPKPAVGSVTSAKPTERADRLISAPEGTVLVRVGEAVTTLFLLVRGTLKIIRPGDHETITKVAETARRAQIEAIGGDHWLANVIAETDVTVRLVGFVELFQVLERERETVKLLNEQNRRRFERFENAIAGRDKKVVDLKSVIDQLRAELERQKKAHSAEVRRFELAAAPDLLPPDSSAILDRIAEVKDLQAQVAGIEARRLSETRELERRCVILKRNLDAMAPELAEKAQLEKYSAFLEAQVNGFMLTIAELNADVARLENKIRGLQGDIAILEIESPSMPVARFATPPPLPPATGSAPPPPRRRMNTIGFGDTDAVGEIKIRVEEAWTAPSSSPPPPQSQAKAEEGEDRVTMVGPPPSRESASLAPRPRKP